MTVPPGKEQELLIDPAVKGTLNVLESAATDPDSTVKRVVLTSSIMAIATDGKDCEEARAKTGKMINEEFWNQSASKDYQPYAYSKTLAEQAAWDFVKKQQDCGFDLVTCNPSFVMGPGVKVHESAESYGYIQMFGSGKLASGSPDLSMTYVDVRDVARGHLAAGFLPSETVANQRYILNGTTAKAIEVGTFLTETFPQYSFPTSTIPKWLFWVVAPYVGLTRKFASRSVARTMEMDNSKSLRDLGLGEYRPLKETMNEMFQQCIDSGFIPTIETVTK